MKTSRSAKILLVDDDPHFRKLVLFLASIAGFDGAFIEAVDGLDALRLFRAEPFDIVITDTNMPNMDGVELLSHVRALFPEVPVVVFFSGRVGSTLTNEDLVQMGATAVLNKWSAPSDLIPLLRSLAGALG